MKNLFLLAAAMLLVACSNEEPAPTATEEAPAAAPVVEEAAPAAEEEAAEDEVLAVVEESASDAEPEEEVILLAQAETSAPMPDWKYNENEHFIRLVPTQPTVGGADQIEVAEFFWYGCPHCYTFEPFINTWADNKAANVRFVRIPAMWNRGLELHAQLYYTEEVLVANGVIKEPAVFREAVFAEYHRRGNRLGSKDAIRTLFGRFDVAEDDFERAWSSFEVNQKMILASDLARRYGIASVPMVVVNGKYRTSGQQAGSNENLLELIDELVAREEVR
ncbi:MAG: thiol:disulfide interchange protein DsbA/DsbL [Woeseiaceae bacterium]